jgi:hypothetical protein
MSTQLYQCQDTSRAVGRALTVNACRAVGRSLTFN